MNSLTAAELKRRGMAAIEEGLRRGPVHLVKRNKPSAVVVSSDEYARLSGKKPAGQVGMTAAQWLLRQPAKGSKTKRQMDTSLRRERDDWR
jgi:prevent-host-death family protein